jgi:DNA topoisomerase VI subunit A
VTHFRHQRECCAAIKQATLILGVPRHALGLTASPRGWYCGDIQILKRNDDDETNNHADGSDDDDDNNINYNDDYKMVLDGRSLQSMHGCPIDASWLVMPQQLVGSSSRGDSDCDDDVHSSSFSSLPLFKIQTGAAKFILVIEKEGIYNRLSEDRFFDTWPCILVTGKGFPDFATRALVQTLHTQLQLPVYGLADGNPFGIQILNTYRNDKDVTRHKNKKKRRFPIYDSSQQRDESQDANGDDVDNVKNPTENQGVSIQWLGFRPSQLEHLKSSLPAAVFQPLTDIDKKRLYALLSLSEADIMDKDNDGDDKDESTASNVGDKDYDDDDDVPSMSSSVLEQHHPWIRQQNASRRRQELQLMLDNNYKVELEALHWLGMDALSEWLGSILEHEQAKRQQQQQQQQDDEKGLESDDDHERDTMVSMGSSWMDII